MCGRRKIQPIEANNDTVEVVSVSTDSAVFSVRLSLDSLGLLVAEKNHVFREFGNLFRRQASTPHERALAWLLSRGCCFYRSLCPVSWFHPVTSCRAIGLLSLESVFSEENQNVEVDSDVIDVVGVSSDSTVFSVRLSLDSLAPDFRLTDTEYMCGPCGPQYLVSRIEEHLRYESSKPISRKEWETCWNSKEDLS